MRNEEIKNCPFCGGEPIVTVMNVGDRMNAQYRCRKCGVTTVPSKLYDKYDAAVAEARKIWNRRLE